MRGWRCGSCGQVVFLDDAACLRCDAALGFRPSLRRVDLVGPGDRRCAVTAESGCGWLVEDGHDRCVACRQVTLVPPLADPATAARYRAAAADHRHLVVQLLELGLPLHAVELRLPSSAHDDTVMIGHVDGVVTIDVAEADDARRERARDRLDEPYRTVLGHLRHEFGHALFVHLVGGQDLGRVRTAFGDERADYQQALDRHYSQGPPDGWPRTHVSAYATMHPSEDWAETFAHVLHVTDVLLAADGLGLALEPDALAREVLGDPPAGPPGAARGAVAMRAALERFVPLAFALNAVSSAVGEGALYPFVLAGPVVDKMALVGELVGVDRVLPA